MDEGNSENILLGGNIELIGFKEIDSGSMIILKKIIGNQVKKISEMCNNFEKLTMNLKKFTNSKNKFEIKIKLIDNGKAYNTDVTDFNLFVTTDKAFSKIESQLSN